MASGAEIDEKQPEAGVKYQQIATVIASEGIQCKCGHAVRALHDGLAQRRHAREHVIGVETRRDGLKSIFPAE